MLHCCRIGKKRRSRSRKTATRTGDCVAGRNLALPSICIQVRRLHDSGKSRWFWFINLIPYVGGLIFLVLMCFDSQRGDNQYGPNPKGEY
ncbi:MAG: DUF805 domain-containing protein [Planctomycetaceae bacterium]|nr:DUF805 domain-containing protein [Planctomycetaceae bacterium]